MDLRGKARRAIILAAFLAFRLHALPAQEGDSVPAWWSAPRGPAYQILVYSFADSDGDGWGDLRGIVDRLDRLNDGDPSTRSDLGVQAIWLSPIHPASSYHGYDVIDYKAVSPVLGTMADFERLAGECRARGIKLILDMVFNHSSREHPWFKAFLDEPEGAYGRYYSRRTEGLRYGTGGKGGFHEAEGKAGRSSYYAAFWEGMPDFDCANPAVIGEFKDILSFWIRKGADGFRFDAVKHIFDPNEVEAGRDGVAMNLAFWRELRAFAKAIKPEVFFLGEVMSDYFAELSRYAASMDSLFDFPAAKRLLAAVSSSSSAESFVPAYEKALAAYSASPGFRPAPFLSNHDQDRSMSAILSRSGLPGAAGWGRSPADGPTVLAAKSAALARAKVAASILFTLPGLPFVYYGEELGMAGRRFLGEDIGRRDAFPWDDARSRPPCAAWAPATGKLETGQNALTPSFEAQDRDPESLLSHYRALSGLMASCPALQGGAWAKADWPGLDGPGIIAYLRSGGGQRLLVVHNLGSAPKEIAAPEGISIERIYGAWGSAARESGGPADSADSAIVAPLGSGVFAY